MSAIAGLIDWGGGPAGQAVRSALHALEWHGRDGQGLWEDGSAALGWRQTILHEEDYNDKQPLLGRSGIRLVLDGRIDNRGDLARQLGLEPAAIQWPDSAYVLASFEKWGVECTEHLLGDYSFAAWDPAARRLVLARDHNGDRPLYFHRGAGFFMFASKPSALFTNPRVPMDLDDEKLVVEITTRSREHGETVFRGIERVQPGHAITVGPDSVTPYRHWRPEAIPELRYKRDDDYVEAFQEILRDSVTCRLRTIHPIGSHLSSGWDSSTVTVTAARLLNDSGRGLTAFTSVTHPDWHPGRQYATTALLNEGPMAAAIAAPYRNITHLQIPGPRTLDFGIVDRHYQASEYPWRLITLLGWQETLHLEARQRGVRVMLSGGLGNRTMSCTGLESLSLLFRRGNVALLLREWGALRRAGHPVRRLAASTFGPYLPNAVWSAVRHLYGDHEPNSGLLVGISPLALSACKLSETNRRRYSTEPNRMDDRSFRRSCTAPFDYGTIWGGFLAAFDLEIRDPSADRRLVEFRAGIPERQFLNRGTTRWLLNRAMTGLLPPEMMNQSARGIQSPDWFNAATYALEDIKGEVSAVAADPRLSAMIDVPRLQQLLEKWPAQLPGTADSLNYRRLLQVVGVARFARLFLERAANRQRPDPA